MLADPIATNSRLGTYTNFVNLLDMCGIAVPTGKRGDGLPMSVTLLAPAGKDASDGGARPRHSRRERLYARRDRLGAAAPSALASAADDGSDRARGGRRASVRHAAQRPAQGARRAILRGRRGPPPAYRLYALAGQSVPKPGLVRVANGGGAAIDVEVWRLDPDAFGRFVAAIPPPLGIGTVLLEDGTAPKGFLVEAAGLDDATDISRLGGWRNFIAASG